LFIENGYGRTTMAEVANRAGVAVETVYAAFRNKANLLRNVWFVAVRGDEDEVRLVERPEIQVVLAEPNLTERLKAHAVVATELFRRITPLLLALQGAAASEPAAAAMVSEFDELRLDATRKYARAAAVTGHLAVGEAACRDVFFATMDGVLWHRLVVGCGWSNKRFAEWLGELWISMLT
jgi:AcrR family transcriptional regulator